MRTKPSHGLSMRDRLSHLSFEEACKMLGPRGRRLLVEGGKLELQMRDIELDDRQARVRWGTSNATRCLISFDATSKAKWRVECSSCRGPCVHAGGFLSLVLEHKSDLGLAAAPPELRGVPLGDDAIVA